MNTVILVPGLGGSGPAHWQSHWETQRPRCHIVQQDNWNIPDYDAWVAGLHAAVMACKKPPLLAAHSLGCALLAHWAMKHPGTPVAGALMVAPADVDSEEHTPFETRAFAPMPLVGLPFPTTVVASTNDSYVDLQRAQVFATAWGSDFVNLGACGHINADSHLKNWDAGWALLRELKGSSRQFFRA